MDNEIGTSEGLMVLLRSEAWGSTSPASAGLARDDEFRRDRFGNLIRWHDCGDRGSPFGWHVARCGNGAWEAIHWRACEDSPGRLYHDVDIDAAYAIADAAIEKGRPP